MSVQVVAMARSVSVMSVVQTDIVSPMIATEHDRLIW